MTINWNNIKSIPNRWMAHWLRKRGWVVFYLDPCNRECRSTCWLKLYIESEEFKHKDI